VFERFIFVKGDVSDKNAVAQAFLDYRPGIVVHLAAQAGVRYSLENPDAYMKSNIIGFYNVLEACRRHPAGHLVFASSSSVYGHNKKVPFSESDDTDNPVSFYAATKKSNELMAYTYSHLYKIPATGLRFFTVYGPLGRPDMAVVHLSGDGSFRMNCTELATIEHYKIPVVSVILNNGVLGMVRQWQTVFYGMRYSHTDMDRGPDFVKLAEAYGVKGYRVEDLESFERAFVEALASGKPDVLDCRVGNDEAVTPMVAPGHLITDFVLD
jgi:hypothetical protein